jgi:serine O-acetyltransferase
MFSSLRADLARFADLKGKGLLRATVEGLAFDNGLQAVVLHRLAHAVRRRRIPILGPAIARCNLFLTGVDISPAAVIGPGLVIAHGVGLVVGGGSRIGARAFLLHQATLGAPSQGRLDEMPTLGDDVFVGAGARIIGRVTIGDRAVIGTNAVIARNIPADHRAVLDVALLVAPRGGREG